MTFFFVTPVKVMVSPAFGSEYRDVNVDVTCICLSRRREGLLSFCLSLSSSVYFMNWDDREDFLVFNTIASNLKKKTWEGRDGLEWRGQVTFG